MPLAVMIMSSLAMALFTYLGKLKGFVWIEEFGLAVSMPASMAGAVVLNIMMGVLYMVVPALIRITTTLMIPVALITIDGAYLLFKKGRLESSLG